MIHHDYHNAHLNDGLKAVARRTAAGFDIFEAIKNRSRHLEFHLDVPSSDYKKLPLGSILVHSNAKLQKIDGLYSQWLNNMVNRNLTPKLNETTDLSQRLILEREITDAKNMIYEIQNHDILNNNQDISSISAVDEGLIQTFFYDSGVKFLNENWHRFKRPTIVTLNLGEMTTFKSEEFRDVGVVLARINLLQTIMNRALKGLKTYAIGGLTIKPIPSAQHRINSLAVDKKSILVSWKLEYKFVVPRWEVSAFLTAWQKAYKAEKIKNAIPVVEVVDYSTAFIINEIFKPLSAPIFIQIPKQNLDDETTETELKPLSWQDRLSLFRVLRNLQLSSRLVFHNVKIVEKPHGVELDFINKVSHHDNIFFHHDLYIEEHIIYDQVGSPLSVMDEYGDED